METLNAWERGENKLSTKSSEIVKKLTDEYEYSLECKLATANKNPVGIIAILNRRRGWNMPGVTRETAKPQLSSSELPKLATELHQNGAQLPDTQAQKPLEIVSDG
jgi:hypothetical protein